jgi:hypothetical protein
MTDEMGRTWKRMWQTSSIMPAFAWWALTIHLTAQYLLHIVSSLLLASIGPSTIGYELSSVRNSFNSVKWPRKVCSGSNGFEQ